MLEENITRDERPGERISFIEQSASSKLFAFGSNDQMEALRMMESSKGQIPAGFPSLDLTDCQPLPFNENPASENAYRKCASGEYAHAQSYDDAVNDRQGANRDGIPDRFVNQVSRIVSGVTDHSLTYGELDYLLKQQYEMMRGYIRALKGGLDTTERNALTRQLDSASFDIFYHKHNKDGGNGEPPGNDHRPPPSDRPPPPPDGHPPSPGQAAPISLDEILNRQDATKNDVLPGLGASDKYRGGWGTGALKTDYYDLSKHPETREIVPWGWIWPEKGKERDANPNAHISVTNRDLWGLRKDGVWVKLSVDNSRVWHAEEEMSNLKKRYSEPVKVAKDGSFTMDGLTPGRLQEFDYSMGRYDSSEYIGIYSSLSIKSDVPNPGFVVQLGADAYGAKGYLKGIGTSNWTEITNIPKTISFTNLSADLLRRFPPPGAR